MIPTCKCTKMKSKIALNIFYTIGAIISVIGIKWAFQNHNYPVGGILVATAIFFFYLKIKLVRDVRQSIKDQTK